VLWTCLIGENISDVCVSKKYEKNQEGPKLIALGIFKKYNKIIILN